MSNKLKKEEIRVSRSAHVFVLLNTGNSAPTDLWIVLHGYGETADAFLSNFDCITSTRRIICAPEALSRFYRSGTVGEIGASWMTTRHRESEIADYTAYLDDVLKTMRRSYPDIDSLTVVGFSQGTATATRWIANSEIRVDRVILWGGAIASDVSAKDLTKSLWPNGANHYQRPIDMVVGQRDQFISEARLTEEMTRMDEMGIPYAVHRFPGGHRLDSETLKDLTGADQ